MGKTFRISSLGQRTSGKNSSDDPALAGQDDPDRISWMCGKSTSYIMYIMIRKDFWHGFVPPNCSVNVVEVTDGKAVLLEDDKVYA